jgi:lipopolysaccharide heptosyltransferase I
VIGGAPRIAIVKLSALGDVVHALPAAHALRRALPGCELAWIVERREAAILAGNADVDHVIPVDTRLWRREFRQRKGMHTVYVKVRGLLRGLRARRYQTALDLQGNLKSGLITALTGAPTRIGFALGHCRESVNVLFTNRRVRKPPGPAHVVEENFALLGALGLGRQALGTPVYPIAADPAADAMVARLLEQDGIKPDHPLLALTPGSGGDGKRWPAEAYRQLGDELALRLGARILICWGPGEEPLARTIARGMRAAPVLPPGTTIPELIALLRRATLAIGGDTGPVHIAAALGVPTLALHGPTDARRNGPYGARVATLQSPTGRMPDITVAAALAAAERLVK